MFKVNIGGHTDVIQDSCGARCAAGTTIHEAQMTTLGNAGGLAFEIQVIEAAENLHNVITDCPSIDNNL